jgi:hypothetical protein
MVLFGIPVILFRSAAADLLSLRSERLLSSRFEIAADTLSGAEAWIEVVLPPLMLAATHIGAFRVVVA